MITSFDTLLAQMERDARPDAHLLRARGRNVPPITYDRWPGPCLAVLAPTHAEGSRAERRAAASKRVRPAPSTPTSRAWLARHRAALAQARCAAREAKRGAA